MKYLVDDGPSALLPCYLRTMPFKVWLLSHAPTNLTPLFLSLSSPFHFFPNFCFFTKAKVKVGSFHLSAWKVIGKKWISIKLV